MPKLIAKASDYTKKPPKTEKELINILIEKAEENTSLELNNQIFSKELLERKQRLMNEIEEEFSLVVEDGKRQRAEHIKNIKRGRIIYEPAPIKINDIKYTEENCELYLLNDYEWDFEVESLAIGETKFETEKPIVLKPKHRNLIYLPRLKEPYTGTLHIQGRYVIRGDD